MHSTHSLTHSDMQSFLERAKFFVKKGGVQKNTNDGRTKWIVRRKKIFSFFKNELKKQNELEKQ